MKSCRHCGEIMKYGQLKCNVCGTVTFYKKTDFDIKEDKRLLIFCLIIGLLAISYILSDGTLWTFLKGGLNSLINNR